MLEPQNDGEGTDYKTYKVAVKEISARTPEQALELAQERAPDLRMAAQLVAIPESSWHVFIPATRWTKV